MGRSFYARHNTHTIKEKDQQIWSCESEKTKDTMAASQDVYKYFSSRPCGNIEWLHFLALLNLCKAIWNVNPSDVCWLWTIALKASTWFTIFPFPICQNDKYIVKVTNLFPWVRIKGALVNLGNGHVSWVRE